MVACLHFLLGHDHKARQLDELHDFLGVARPAAGIRLDERQGPVHLDGAVVAGRRLQAEVGEEEVDLAGGAGAGVAAVGGVAGAVRAKLAAQTAVKKVKYARSGELL